MFRGTVVGVCMFLAIVIPSTTGCERECTKIGCGSGITVTSTPAMAVTSVTICAEKSCGTFEPRCGADETCRATLPYTTQGPGRITVDIMATPAQGPPVERHERVSMEPVYPNGKRCGAACRVATIPLSG